MSFFGNNKQTIAWHRGDVSYAQENSQRAIEKSFNSSCPNIEVDVLDFVDNSGKRTGILAHDYNMKYLTESKGLFANVKNLSELPPTTSNKNLKPEPFVTVLDLMELINLTIKKGITPYVSLDIKAKGKSGREFGRWLGKLIQRYKFANHVFASSFHNDSLLGIKETCPDCLIGGLIYTNHFALKKLKPQYSTLDLTIISKLTFFCGFLARKQFNHDFILIQDDVLFKNSHIIDYWKNIRKVKFIGTFASIERSYTQTELKILEKADWLELEPQHINQILTKSQPK